MPITLSFHHCDIIDVIKNDLNDDVISLIPLTSFQKSLRLTNMRPAHESMAEIPLAGFC